MPLLVMMGVVVEVPLASWLHSSYRAGLGATLGIDMPVPGGDARRRPKWSYGGDGDGDYGGGGGTKRGVLCMVWYGYRDRDRNGAERTLKSGEDPWTWPWP